MTDRQDNGEHKETDKHRGKKERHMTETKAKLCRKDTGKDELILESERKIKRDGRVRDRDRQQCGQRYRGLRQR
jgi:hypothetical protein